MSEENTQECTTGTCEAPKAEKAPKAPGVGAVAKELILEGKSNQEVLEAIQARFPEAKTTVASINWYRNKMRADGVEGVKTSREIKAANKPAPAPKEKKAKAKKGEEAPAAEADILA